MILTAAFAFLIAAQPAEGPKLARGQELLYRGTHVEESHPNDATSRKEYELDIRVFVRDQTAQGSSLAVCTTLKAARSATAGSARFELATVDPHGRVRLANGSTPPFAPDGPPVIECAGFIERPTGSPESWTESSAQPPIRWRSLGVESLRLVRCFKFVGEQDSDWNHPNGTRASWRRTDTVWVNSSTGLVERLDRDIEYRSPSAEDTVHLRTNYELVGGISLFPGSLGDDRQSEIQQAALFQQELRNLQAKRGAAPAAYSKLIGKIDAFVEMAPATPFRAAIAALRARADAGRRGEPPPPGSP
jgi:hypothetical protein